MAMLSIFVILSLFPFLLATDDPYTIYHQLDLPSDGSSGPEAVAFDRLKQGPYVAVSDGRILKYGGPDVGFQEFSCTSPNRTEQCEGVNETNSNPACGRPMGLSFKNILTLSLFDFPVFHFEDLYIVDSFNGLFKVGSRGGKAELIANSSAGGVPFGFPSGIDVHPITGDVYFTDASEIESLSNLLQGKFVPDATGRLLRYSPLTGEVEILLEGLISPAGPVISHDGSFLLFSSIVNRTIQKYELTFPKSTTHRTLLTFEENLPTFIKRAFNFGEFWVSANRISTSEKSLNVSPTGYKFSSDGSILIKKDFGAQYPGLGITGVQEHDDEVLYVASAVANFVGVYTKN